MRKAQKALLAVACAGALALGGAGSLAYFTDSEKAVNTFTVGKVGISLDEVDYDNDDNKADNVTIGGVVRDTANKYHLIPGQTYEKDPTVRVDADSDECWLFVKVENEISAIETKDEANTIVQMRANGWTLVDGETNVFAHKDKASAGDDVVVFERFVIDGASVDNATLAKYETGAGGNKAITVTAYAVQAAGFGTAQAAWDAAFKTS